MKAGPAHSGSILLCNRLHDPTLVGFREFAGGETPHHDLLLREITRIAPRLPVKADTNGSRARAARPDEIGGEAELVGKLIEQAALVGQEFVEDERVAIAEKEQGAVRIRRNGGAVRF